MKDPGQAIAEKMVETLLAGSFSLNFEALVPENPARFINNIGKLPTDSALTVYVVPVSETAEPLGNNAGVNELIEINVFVSRLLGDSYRRSVLGDFVRELRVALRLREIDVDLDDGLGMAPWYWNATTTVTKYDAEQIAVSDRFLSVFSETYYRPC